MSTALRKILFILIVVIILPFILYTSMEISTLNEDEEMLEEIYNRQLEAILFSINQYSDDIVSSQAREMEADIDQVTDPGFESQIPKASKSLYFINLRTVENDKVNYWYSFAELQFEIWKPLIDSIFNRHSLLTDRLVAYKESGFRKIEPLGSISLDQREYSLLLYLLEKNDVMWYCLTAVEPTIFTEQILAPKMQEIAREDFVVLVKKSADRSTVFATDTLTGEEVSARALWLLPDYEVAIAPRGRTIKDIVSERTTVNLVLIVSLSILMLLGFWLVFSNIRKEMRLAQNKSDFVSNVSHEIRTPLSLISMFAETLLMGRATTEEKKQTYYSIIHKETARLARIVNRILDFSKIEANKKRYDKALVAVNDVVKQVAETYSFHLQNKGFKYQVTYGEQLPGIQGDPEAMVEAVINLLDNAIKYSDGVKNIEIKTGTYGQFVFIAVKDHGIGMDPKAKKQIFEKFYRITKSDVHDTKGVGLGLSLVKHIMDAHQGKIMVESELGKGSTFQLLFPVDKINHKQNAEDISR